MNLSTASTSARRATSWGSSAALPMRDAHSCLRFTNSQMAHVCVTAACCWPLDGVLVPTFGSAYVAITLLFPFVAIRALGREKETGVLRLLVQLPYGTATLVLAKFMAVLVAWFLASIPVLSALIVWKACGGH